MKNVYLSYTCGCESISRLHEQAFPSVDIVIRLWAFSVPTTAAQYIGCCEIETTLRYICGMCIYVYVWYMRGVAMHKNIHEWSKNANKT